MTAAHAMIEITALMSGARIYRLNSPSMVPTTPPIADDSQS